MSYQIAGNIPRATQYYNAARKLEAKNEDKVMPSSSLLTGLEAYGKDGTYEELSELYNNHVRTQEDIALQEIASHQ